jgi:hypothetical protein
MGYAIDVWIASKADAEKWDSPTHVVEVKYKNAGA